MPTLADALAGISGILITPFDAEDRLAPARLTPIVERAIEAGVGTLVANGNTSEFYALTLDEATAMVSAVAELIEGRVPLVGGVGRSAADACVLARASRKAGAAALMIHQPPDPFAAPRGILAYVRKIADAAAGLPLILYVRNDEIGLDTIEQLCRLETVIGVKWATPAPVRLCEAIRRSPPHIRWSCGLAETWAPPLYAVGARGFTSGLVNVLPQRSIAILRALDNGNYDLARNLIAAIAPFEELRAQERSGANVSVVKAALKLQGIDCGHVRPPGAWPLSSDVLQQLSVFLA